MGIISAFGLYFATLGIIGFFAYKRSKQSTDFTLGSRSLSYWVTALAAHASDMSGWLFMGFPAAVYAHGLIEAWTAVGLVFFMFLNWKLIAPKLRPLTEKHNSSTLSSFFEAHFEDSSGLIRMVSALFCLMFFTFYIAANFVALGHLFESIFNINYAIGTLIGSLIIFYILLGGYTSIAWVDFFQGSFLLLMIILVPIVGFLHVGGSHAIVNAASANTISLTFLPHSISQFFNILLLAFGWGLGYFGQPHILTKFMGIQNVENLAKAQRVGLAWQTITLLSAICVGLVGIAFFAGNGLPNSELIFVAMTKTLFKPFWAGIILCAVLASAINVIGAQILVSVSVLAEDFYKHLINEKNRAVTRYRVQWASHVGVFSICLLALTFAYYQREESISGLIEYAWAGLGSSFGPLIILSLHSKLKSRAAALAGIIAGGATAGLWYYFDTVIPPMIAGFVASFVCIGLVALVTKNK